MHPTIAFLATGDEIIEGDVVNTSTPAIAQALKPLGANFGLQMSCDDNQAHIAQALQHLLADHAAVIITGGLGPTSDDRTRYAVAEVTQTQLKLDEDGWQRVYDYIFKKRGFVPENNKQQCLFPEGSVVLTNHTGTADGCHITIQAIKPEKIGSDQQHIFMLPGPPSQALPIVHDYLYPFFHKSNFAKDTYRSSWMLLNASESHIATLIDEALGESQDHVTIGYRFDPPYLQVKLQALNEKNYHQAHALIEPILAPYVWRTGNLSAIELWQQNIHDDNTTWMISDQITHGFLNTALFNTQTKANVTFAPNHMANTDYQLLLKSMQPICTDDNQTMHPKKVAWSMTLITPTETIENSFEHALLCNNQVFKKLSQLIAIEVLKHIDV